MKRLKIKLPEVPSPAGSYVPLVEAGKLAFLSGLLPKDGGQIVCRGRAGDDVTAEQSRDAARLCALNALSVLRAHFGTLDRVNRIVRVAGFVQVAPEFHDIPKIMNGASDLFVEIFGERGVHARSAVGAASLPGNAVCELEITVEVE